MDGPGWLDSKGKPEFAYAHPPFRAPRTIIGDAARDDWVRGQTVNGHLAKGIQLGALVASLLAWPAANATKLITDEEARLPPPKGAANSRGILRGPRVEVVSPNEPSHSPLRLQLKFESFGGAKINIETVRVIYLRTPNVDLTDRVRPFIQADGIDMPDAELPPGEYMMRVEVRDSDGRPGSASFTLKISP